MKRNLQSFMAKKNQINLIILGNFFFFFTGREGNQEEFFGRIFHLFSTFPWGAPPVSTFSEQVLQLPG